nr:UDP binding domain-containing protein [uncultured Desulfuromusa sp.]
MDIVRELQEFNIEVDVYDPWVDVDEAGLEYGIKPVTTPEQHAYDGIILAVGLQQFAEMGADAVRQFGKNKHVLYDLKYVFLSEEVDLRL